MAGVAGLCARAAIGHLLWAHVWGSRFACRSSPQSECGAGQWTANEQNSRLLFTCLHQLRHAGV